MVCSVAQDLEGFAGPIGPAVNEQTVVKWSVLSRSYSELINVVQNEGLYILS